MSHRLASFIALGVLLALPGGLRAQASPQATPLAPGSLVLSLPSASALGIPPLPSPRLVPIPVGDDKIVSLQRDQAAPFSGHLFDLPTAMRWGNYLEQCRLRLDLDVRAERERGQVEVQFWRARLEQDHSYYLSVLGEQQKQVTQLSLPPGEPPIYARGWFLFGMGFVTASVAVGVGAYALGR